ncbi:two-component system, sensor histidine kinase [freshwater sediment metagenome]|uniref:histidine kinase n=1 Tax=freshwater sediment metagenome TaxID=556182 RepID=A0AA48RCS0_9ZZZZ
MQNTSELRARNPAEDRDIVSKGPPDLHQIAQQWENFARAQELGQIGWWRLDTTTNVLTWSEENYRIFGAPSGKPQTYQTFLDAIHPADRQAVDEKWGAALRGESYDIEHRIIANGQVKWVREKATLEFDETGALRGGFGITQDITDRKAVEQALQWSVRRNELLTKTAARLLETTDVQGLVDQLCAEVMAFLECDVFFNFLADEQAKRLRLNACAGIPRGVAEEIEWLDFGVAVCGCVARDRERVIAENIGAVVDERTTLIRSFGIESYCCHPLMSQGRLIGTLSFGSRSRPSFREEEIEVMQAVSNLVAMAMARLGMEQALREADRRKDEFLATLAHELRNPLAPIRSGLQVLKSDSGAWPKASRIIEIMARQVDHIVRLVDDLMEVSRIRNGKIALRLERVDLTAVIRQAVESCQQVMEASGVALSVATPDTPLYVEGDSVRLSQIVSNLLNNAAKYTEAGGRVEIAAGRLNRWAVLSVEDTGVGIPKEMLPHVFDLFAQVDRTLGRAQGGLGIGLALVRKLVTLHGGEVEAQSRGPGLGSRFVLRLPLSKTAAAGASDENGPSEASTTKRVLVIDDNRDAAVSMSMLLETLGASARVASDGESGVAAFEHFHPGLVFLDLGMPGIDGFETARRLRATPEGRAATIVALTGWGGEATRARTREAGFDLHLTKPASVDDVRKALAFRAS